MVYAACPIHEGVRHCGDNTAHGQQAEGLPEGCAGAGVNATTVAAYLAAFPALFHRVRTERRLTLWEVGMHTGLSPATVWRVEQGHPFNTNTLAVLLKWIAPVEAQHTHTDGQPRSQSA